MYAQKPLLGTEQLDVGQRGCAILARIENYVYEKKRFSCLLVLDGA